MTSDQPAGARPVTDLDVLLQTPAWIGAAPFRAHLRRLVAETGENPRVLALAAGVAPTTVRTLLAGRDGRRRRIRACDAIRILQLDRVLLAELAVTPVPAHDTRRRLAALRSLDAAPAWFSRQLRLDADGGARLARAEWCSALMELRVAAACGAAGLCGWWSGDAWFDDSVYDRGDRAMSVRECAA